MRELSQGSKNAKRHQCHSGVSMTTSSLSPFVMIKLTVNRILVWLEVMTITKLVGHQNLVWYDVMTRDPEE